MADLVTVTINGRRITVPAGTTVAVALMSAGCTTFRRSVSGEPRGPLCGMGICFECRVSIDGRPHRRSCQTLCRSGMEIRADE